MSDAIPLSRAVFSDNTMREDLTFVDDAGQAFVPTTLEYRCVNKETGLQIVDWTNVAETIAATMSVEFPATLFPTQDLTLESEVHEVTLFADRNVAGSRISIVYDVTVRRAGVQDPP